MQLGGDLGDVLGPPFTRSLSSWGSFSQDVGCGTHRFQFPFGGYHLAASVHVCVCGGWGSVHTGGSDQDLGLLRVKAKSRKRLWRVRGWGAPPPPSKHLYSESGVGRGPARQHPRPAPLTCFSAVSSSLHLLLRLHPVSLPLRAHWILNDGSVSPTPTLGHSRAFPEERRQGGP